MMGSCLAMRVACSRETIRSGNGSSSGGVSSMGSMRSLRFSKIVFLLRNNK